MRLNYSWTQVSGPTVAITGANAAIATFTAAGSTSYGFRSDGYRSGKWPERQRQHHRDHAESIASGAVHRRRPARSPRASRPRWRGTCRTRPRSVFRASARVCNPSGTATVSPTTTTTYNSDGYRTRRPDGYRERYGYRRRVQAEAIIRFAASPTHISQGQSSLLSWTTTGASTVSISNGVGTVPANGSQSVSPATTTTYTLTATGADGTLRHRRGHRYRRRRSACRACISFTASPDGHRRRAARRRCAGTCPMPRPSASSATVGTVTGATGCTTVTPSATTTYVLTATNAVGPIQAVGDSERGSRFRSSRSPPTRLTRRLPARP